LVQAGGAALGRSLSADGGLTLGEPSGATALVPCLVRSSNRGRGGGPRARGGGKDATADTATDGHEPRRNLPAVWATYDAAEALRAATLVFVATKRGANGTVRALLQKHCGSGGDGGGGSLGGGSGGAAEMRAADCVGNDGPKYPTVVLLQNGLDAAADFEGPSKGGGSELPRCGGWHYFDVGGGVTRTLVTTRP
jgi:hypothetical protein